jgi:hypothetical protein
MDSRPAAGDANPVARFHEHVLQERQGELFPPGASVLDVGRDVREGRWDAGFAACEAAVRLGPAEVGRRLAAALPAGAPILVAFPGALPLPALLERVLTGMREDDESDRGPLTARALRRALGPGLEWRGTFALGVLLPPRRRWAWTLEHPQAFGLLAALERLVRAWPGLRSLGEITVLEGIRR